MSVFNPADNCNQTVQCSQRLSFGKAGQNKDFTRALSSWKQTLHGIPQNLWELWLGLFVQEVEHSGTSLCSCFLEREEHHPRLLKSTCYFILTFPSLALAWSWLSKDKVAANGAKKLECTPSAIKLFQEVLCYVGNEDGYEKEKLCKADP